MRVPEEGPERWVPEGEPSVFWRLGRGAPRSDGEPDEDAGEDAAPRCMNYDTQYSAVNGK